MFMIREVLNCKPGKVGALAKKFKDLGEVMRDLSLEPFRIYTDVAGAPFWTLVLEREYESLDEILEVEGRVMSDERAGPVMSGYHELIVVCSRSSASSSGTRTPGFGRTPSRAWRGCPEARNSPTSCLCSRTTLPG